MGTKKLIQVDVKAWGFTAVSGIPMILLSNSYHLWLGINSKNGSKWTTTPPPP